MTTQHKNPFTDRARLLFAAEVRAQDLAASALLEVQTAEATVIDLPSTANRLEQLADLSDQTLMQARNKIHQARKMAAQRHGQDPQLQQLHQAIYGQLALPTEDEAQIIDAEIIEEAPQPIPKR